MIFEVRIPAPLLQYGHVRRFDVKPYLDKGIFQELKDWSLFNSVKPCLGSVQWKNGQDFCPDTLYEDSAPVTDKIEAPGEEQAVV